MKTLLKFALILMSFAASAQFEQSGAGYTRLANPDDKVGIGTLVNELPEAKLHLKNGGLLVERVKSPGKFKASIGDPTSSYLFFVTDTLNFLLSRVKSTVSLGYSSFLGLTMSENSNIMILKPNMFLSSSLLDVSVGSLKVKTGNNPNSLIIDKKGYVGIGTNPDKDTLTERLEVKGNMKLYGKLAVQKICVTHNSSWCDYVFEPGYKLRPLNDLEIFVKKHKHLPEIPSEEEVKNGYELNQMDAMLLKKIEELTLYVIELEKKIKSLQEERY